jgi:hypothetical protein
MDIHQSRNAHYNHPLAIDTQFLVIKPILTSLALKWGIVVVISDALSNDYHGNNVRNFS